MKKSASLRALGLNNNDERELAVHWRRIGVSYAPPGMPRANGKNVSDGTRPPFLNKIIEPNSHPCRCLK